MIRQQWGIPLRTEEPKEPAKKDFFDITTKVLLPIAFLVIAQLQTQGTRLWTFLSLGVLALLVSFWKDIRNAIMRLRRRSHDRGQMATIVGGLRHHVEVFGQFVDTGSSDTLHRILASEVFRNNSSDFQKCLPMPEVRLFNDFWYYLDERLHHETLRLPRLQITFTEFHNLISSFTRDCVLPSFDNLPRDVRGALSPEVRASLNGFQQRYVRFLHNYVEFAKHSADSLQTIKLEAHYLQLPKPLS